MDDLKLTCIIIDDEPLARARLNSLVSETTELVLLNTCGTGKGAVELIDTLEPDLIFLDIQMKDMTGFDVLRKIKTEKKPLVIFVTAFDKYAVKAFDIFAIDYLLKPFKKDRFLLSIQRVLAHYKKQRGYDSKMDHLLQFVADSVKVESGPFSNKFPIKTGNAISFIEIDTIMYVL
ncbi:MAG: response regulator, partial [Bacteroidota bacterium]